MRVAVLSELPPGRSLGESHMVRTLSRGWLPSNICQNQAVLLPLGNQSSLDLVTFKSKDLAAVAVAVCFAGLQRSAHLSK